MSHAVVTISQGDSDLVRYSVGDELGVGDTTLDIWYVVNLMVDEQGNVVLNTELHGFFEDDPGGTFTIPPPVTPPDYIPCPGTATVRLSGAE